MAEAEAIIGAARAYVFDAVSCAPQQRIYRGKFESSSKNAATSVGVGTCGLPAVSELYRLLRNHT